MKELGLALVISAAIVAAVRPSTVGAYAMSILSELPDGAGYYYGFARPDMRQINVRQGPVDLLWRAYVGGVRIGDLGSDSDESDWVWETKDEAEAAAIAWVKANPDPDLLPAF